MIDRTEKLKTNDGTMEVFVTRPEGAGPFLTIPLIIQSMLVAKTARPEHMTEAFTWSASALLCGVGIGMAAGGGLLEYWTSPTVLAAGALAALLAAAAAAAVTPTLSRRG